MKRTHKLGVAGICLVLMMPLVGAITPEAPVTSTPQLMNVGFFVIPDGLEEGGEYNGERILSVNRDIQFIALEVQNPTVLRARVMLDDNVRYISDDYVGAVKTFFTPNDPGYSQQYGWVTTKTDLGWDVTRGTTAVTVAVLDTGIQASHPDFTPSRVLTGITYAGGNQRADGNGHGTHVSGTVGATINNGIGGAGASQSNILPVKVLDDSGSGTFAGVANGITWAANNGAHIESLSLGCAAPCSDPGTSDAIAYARNTKGLIVVVAAGNDAGAVGFPGSDPNAYTVACVDSANAACSFTNFGPEVEISAPGLGIYSTWIGSTYNTISGTSMSTPHVSGIAALVKTMNPSFTGAQIESKLSSTAIPISAGSGMGAGLVNGQGAVGGAPPPGPTVPGVPTLSATGGSSSISLSWTTPSDGGSPITGYRVYRSTTSNGQGPTPYATLGVVTAYEDTTVTLGTVYYYKVTAVNAIGEGARSNEASASAGAPPPPPPPPPCTDGNCEN